MAPEGGAPGGRRGGGKGGIGGYAPIGGKPGVPEGGGGTCLYIAGMPGGGTPKGFKSG